MKPLHRRTAKASRSFFAPAILVAAALLAAAPAAAQAPGSSPFSFWTTPTAPFHIVGPIYYVGTLGLGVYLIATGEGHILIDAGMPGRADLISASVEELGFEVSDIRILAVTHAHFDHVGGLADLEAMSHAEVAAMDGDKPLLESGGAADILFGALPSRRFPPVEVDRVLHDGDTVSLGGVTLTAHLGAGHTPGATTWTTTVEEDGRSYDVVFPCCTTVGGTMIMTGPDAPVPGIADDYRRTFAMLESLAPDIVLPAHTETFDFVRHRQRAARVGPSGWEDLKSYREWVAAGREQFESIVADEAAHRR